MPDSSNSGRLVRFQLVVITVCWFAVTIAQGYLAPPGLPWTTTVVAYLSAGAGICTLALAAIPSTEVAYRVGGTLGVGTIGFRIVCLFRLGLEDQLPIDDVITSVAITVMFSVLYWQWWLNVVRRWRKISRWTQPPL